MLPELVHEYTVTVEDYAGYTGQAPQLYVWEINKLPGRDHQLLSLPECQSLVKLAWSDQLGITIPPPTINDGRGSPCARSRPTCIYLPRWARNPIIVMHELAHCVTDLFDNSDSAAHGSKYLQVYLTLLASNTQHKYSALRSDAMSYGLKVSGIDVMKKMKRFQRWK